MANSTTKFATPTELFICIAMSMQPYVSTTNAKPMIANVLKHGGNRLQNGSTQIATMEKRIDEKNKGLKCSKAFFVMI